MQCTLGFLSAVAIIHVILPFCYSYNVCIAIGECTAATCTCIVAALNFKLKFFLGGLEVISSSSNLTVLILDKI